MQSKKIALPELPGLVSQFIAAHPGPTIVGLSGELGAGKTTFVREVIRQLASTPVKVTSPSFVLHQSYKHLLRPVDHFDLYRLDSVTFDSLVDIGYFDVLEEARAKNGFVFIEWPEKSKASLLELDLSLTITIDEPGRRYDELDAFPLR